VQGQCDQHGSPNGYRAPDVGTDVTHDRRVHDLERWFVERGLPHFVDSEDTAGAIWSRAVWLLIVAAILRGFGALDVRNWSLAENLAAAAIVIVLLVGTWVASNIVRRRPPLGVPRVLGSVELGLFLLIPALPAAIFGQWRDALEAIVIGVVLLLVIYFVTSYGVLPLLGWAGSRAIAQFAVFGGVVVRALPLLLLFTTFLFINAEVWEVAGTLHGLVYAAVLGIFFLLGAVFVLSRVPALMKDLSRFDDWSEIEPLVVDTPAAFVEHPVSGPHPRDPLTMRQRFNIGLVTVFNQAIQITLVALALTAFFVVFGILAISETTALGWTGLEDVNVLASLSVGDRPLVLSEPLLRVAGFLGAFSGMYFTVVLTTDATYRDEFAEDVAPTLRTALAARAVYRQRRRAPTAAPASTEATVSDTTVSDTTVSDETVSEEHVR
jgi:hypothetical protein